VSWDNKSSHLEFVLSLVRVQCDVAQRCLGGGGDSVVHVPVPLNTNLGGRDANTKEGRVLGRHPF
jgi:hypothetical protein